MSDAARILIVTGLSGAGKSTALKSLEDIGYEAVDNLPVKLLPRLARLDDSGEDPALLAIGVDCRTRAFRVDDLIREISAARPDGAPTMQLLYLDCREDELERRYSETRRRHPLAMDAPVTEGLARERELMRPLMEGADFILDTTGMTVHDTRRWVHRQFGRPGVPELQVSVTSFSYARGIPRDADLVFDVRFLRNPHYDDALRALTGTDDAVARYVRDDPDFAGFIEALEGLFALTLPRYRREGKSYLTIAFGCTGGRHRSVALAEHVGKGLEKQQYRVTITHRDHDRPLGVPADER